MAQSLLSHIADGGLGIISLYILNEACNLKLCWEMIESNTQWSEFFRSRVLKKN